MRERTWSQEKWMGMTSVHKSEPSGGDIKSDPNLVIDGDKYPPHHPIHLGYQHRFKNFK